MRKEIEINGCIKIPPEMTVDEFCDAFIELIEPRAGTSAAVSGRSWMGMI